MQHAHLSKMAKMITSFYSTNWVWTSSSCWQCLTKIIWLTALFRNNLEYAPMCILTVCV